MAAGVREFCIGVGEWASVVRKAGEAIDRSYWDRFRPWTEGDLALCQRLVGRTFPDEYRAFVLTFGTGDFASRFGGGFYTPVEVIAACHGPLMAVLGSTEWASDAEHLHFYATRGTYNPSPDRFTPVALRFSGTTLLDLLQIGTDGSSGYLQIGVGNPPGPVGFGVLLGDQLEDVQPTFSAGLRHILSRHAAE